MNDEMVQAEARERLLTAELVEVLAGEMPVGEVATSGRRRALGVSAVLLLGAVVVLGVAFAERVNRSSSAQGGAPQHPRFDPVDPDYEHEWPFRRMLTALTQPGHAAEAPAGVDDFVVTLRDEDSADLADVLARPTVHRLALCWRNDGAAANVALPLWQRIATRRELEVLQLSGPFALAPERLRELRLAPELRSLQLASTAALDEVAARALLELPRLRALMLGRLEVTPAGLAVLAGLPNLETLLLSTPKIDAAVLLRVLPTLRSLRALVFDGETVLDAAALHQLADMPRLRALELCLFTPLDDAALAALPPQLELLALPPLDRCTAAGLDALRRLRHLRTLRLRAALPARLQRALPSVLLDLPLERFDDLVGVPDAATWAVLQQQPKLRRLSLRPSGPIDAVIAGCRGCAHLETVSMTLSQLPTPEQLAPLKDHPTLQRIAVLFSEPSTPAPTAQQLAALRASVRAQVELIWP